MFLQSTQSELAKTISVVCSIDRSPLNVLYCVEVDLVDGSNLLSNVDWTTDESPGIAWGCSLSGTLTICF